MAGYAQERSGGFRVELVLDGEGFLEKPVVVAKLAEERLDASKIGRKLHECLAHLDEHALLALAHGTSQRAHLAEVARAARFGEGLTPVHHFHQPRGRRRRRRAFADRTTVADEQRFGPAHRIAEHPKCLVHFDGTPERLLPLAARPPGVAVGMQRTAELAMTPFERRGVELEHRREAESVERVAQRRQRSVSGR